MLFNSLDFAVFLPIVFIVYWILLSKSFQKQNLFVLFASYIFYGWWDWRFLILIFLSSVIDFWIGSSMHVTKQKSKRKFLLLLSIIINIGLLCYFKYFNFFIEGFSDAFSFLGYEFNIERINIILPVGISFYTFQTLSYTIDIYQKKLKPTSNIIEFLAFVSFFPQLVAGPIERARDLLPQFGKKRVFNEPMASDGMRQILSGLFKKIVIADNCAIYVNDIFANHEMYSGIILLLGGVLFAFQIYGDFSGYSDIAIGVAAILGFQLSQNFAFPYFSRDIAEFWRRWHISLSTWFRDYIYIPIGGSRCSNIYKIRNVFLVFTISGLWHGANYTFIAWGILHSLFFIPILIRNNNRRYLDVLANNRAIPSFRETISVCVTFILVVLGWIVFRSENIYVAQKFYLSILTDSINFYSYREAFSFLFYNVGLYFILILSGFVCIEFFGRKFRYGLEVFKSIRNPLLRKFVYVLTICTILFFSDKETPFIYFQF